LGRGEEARRRGVEKERAGESVRQEA
jgi:hypothetical protein